MSWYAHSTIAEHAGVRSARYQLLAADLRAVEEVEKLLVSVGLDVTLPTLFVSEAVLMYTNPVDSERLMAWSGTRVSPSMFAIYEPINPHDSFGRMMVDNLKVYLGFLLFAKMELIAVYLCVCLFLCFFVDLFDLSYSQMQASRCTIGEYRKVSHIGRSA